MKIVFFGSDDFATRHLEALLNSSFKVVGCVTQVDKPKDRGMKISFSSVKACALEYNIPLFQPIDLKDPQFISQLKNLGADIFIVIAYGKILSQTILDIPKRGCFNVHGSLLPQYRGAAPINWAIINGEKETGLSIILMNSLMDAGDIVAQKIIMISSDETSISLRAKMMEGGPAFLLETLKLFQENRCTQLKQDSKLVTLAPKLTKELGQIEWHKNADEIHHLVRGLLPWPTAYTFYNGKILKILKSEVVTLEDASLPAGTIVEINKQGFLVATGKDRLLIKEVHLQDSRAMDAPSFVRGHKIEKGFKF